MNQPNIPIAASSVVAMNAVYSWCQPSSASMDALRLVEPPLSVARIEYVIDRLFRRKFELPTLDALHHAEASSAVERLVANGPCFEA
jgi:hypothetical protein